MMSQKRPAAGGESCMQDGNDIHSHMMLVQHVNMRKTVADTDVGKEIKESIIDLEKLLCAYREGAIVERQ